MAPKRGFDFSLARQYDKFIAVLVLVGLLASLFVLARSGNRNRADEESFKAAVDSLKPAVPLAAPLDLDPYDRGLRDLHRPLNVVQATNGIGLFVPERRVWCLDCRQPIAYEALECPFCHTKQPPLPKEIPADEVDTDRDGMPDVWEKRHGFDPFNPADAQQDADADGFSNLDEFLAGTNPADATRHPDSAQLLKMKECRTWPFPFVFRSASLMPDNRTWKCAFNLRGRNETLFVAEGQPIGNTGLTLARYERKTEKRPNEKFGGMLMDVDVSEVLIVRPADKKAFTLHIDDAQAAMEQEVVLTLSVAGKHTEYPVSNGATLDLQSEKYKVEVVIPVDGKAPTVVLENVHTAKKYTVTQ